MKTLFLTFALLSSSIAFSQKLSPREKQLYNLLEKSYYLKNSTKDYKIFVAKKYACFEKYYNIKPEEHKEFIRTKKQLKQEYGEFWNNPQYVEGRSLLEELKRPENFNPITNKHEEFPKCLSKKEFDY